MKIIKLKLTNLYRYVFMAFGAGLIWLMVASVMPYSWGITQQKDCDIAIYITGNLFHTDIWVPVKTSVFDWNQFIKLSEIGQKSSGSYRYLALGWGDRNVYLQSPTLGDLQPGIALKALFLPTSSVMRVQGYDTLPSWNQLKPINISKDNYLNLVAFLQNSFSLNSQGKPINISYGYGNRDSFYKAQGQYSIIRHCNTWTAEALRSVEVQTPRQPTLPILILWKAKSSCKAIIHSGDVFH